MKAKYLVSCAMAAILSGGALAARAADPDTPPTAGGPAASTAAAAGTSSGGGVEQVVVTAQRRTEDVEKVPMTVQALTGKTLQQLNIVTLDDLLKFTPNVTFASNGPGQGNIFMRGLSSGFAGNQSSATVASFPNVAVYLDDQSMSFPSRNADIYMADMDRVEVLEGPQGTLFGGGAEAGALRYITNKPNLDQQQAHIEAGGGLTDGGGPNYNGQAMLNLPIVPGTFAVRAVVYGDHQGGYIDNVPSTFQRSNQDLGNYYFGIKPSGGVCLNGLPGGPSGCTLSNNPIYNNYALAKKDSNPIDYDGARLEAKYQINPDWDVLITESLQSMDATGLSVEYPTGSNFQPLGPLQVTAFEPSYEKDNLESTAWTVNGKIGDLKAIYTGGYTVRHIKEQMDYTNYSRTGGGMYYECTGGTTGWGKAAPTCYSPLVYWQDTVKNTHLSNEVRLSSPDDWRLRFMVGAYYEQFRIDDVMNFQYKTIPSCSPANLTAALAGGPICVANVTTAPGSTANDPGERGDMTAFGEDTQRGYDQTAFFGSVDFDIIPNVLTVTGGTRWYDYNEFEVGSQYGTGTYCMNVPNGQCTGGEVNIDSHNDRVSYKGFKSRAVLTWHVTPDTLGYFLFSQGFRPGGFNRSNSKEVIKDATGAFQFLEPNSYAPDSLTNYEAGVKTQLLDHRLQLNVSAYYMDWDNVQYFLFAPAYSINTTFGINGPSYTIKGAEAQVVARVTDNLTIQASGSYNDASESQVPCLPDNVSGTADFGHCISQAVAKGTGLGSFANPFGFTGAIPPFSPKLQGNIRARYDWMIMDYKAFVQGDVNYTGGVWNQPASYLSGAGVLVPNTTYLRYYQPAYTTIDASVGIAKDNWYAEIYGTNLTDSHASTFTSSAQFIKSEVPLRPLVVGIKVGANF